MKKRILIAFMAMILMSVFLATGCTPTVPPAAEPATSEPTNAPTKEAVSQKTDNEETAAPTAQPKSVVAGTPGTHFTKDDVYVADFKIGDDKDSVLALAGEPSKSYDVTLEATGEVRNINDYSFGSMVFVDDKLVVIQILDDTYEGPRGIKVGMDLDDAIALFTTKVEHDTDYMSIFYRANPDGDEFTTVPPYGMLYKGDMQTLTFSVFTENSGADAMSLSELEADYRFMEQYELTCEFDAQGVMFSFAVRVGTPSE